MISQRIMTSRFLPPEKLDLLFGIIISLGLVGVHATVLTHAGVLWRDEINTINIATMPTVLRVWELAEFDSYPMAWFLVVRTWVAWGFGTSDLTLRLLGFGVGLGVIAAAWWVVRQFDVTVPLLSLVLFCLSPTAFRIGDSLRAYGCGVLLMLLMVGTMWRLLKSPTPQRAVVAAVTAVAAVQCLYYNAMILLTLCGSGIVVSASRRSKRLAALVLAVGACAALSLLPYYSAIVRLQSWNSLVKAPISPIWLGFKLTETLVEGGRSTPWVWLALLVICLHFLSRQFPHLRHLPAQERELVLFCATSTLVGLASYTVFLLTLSYYTAPWYYITLMAFMALQLDLILFQVVRKKHAWRLGRLVLLLLFALTVSRTVWSSAHTRQTNVDLLAAKLEVLAKPEDLVILHPWWPALSFARYFHGSTPWTTLPEIGHHPTFRYDLVKERFLQNDPIGPLVAKTAETLKSGHRVWLVGDITPLKGNEEVGTAPPRPNGKHGWEEWPHLRFWSRQLLQVIRSSNATVSKLDISSEVPINQFENFNLYRVDTHTTERVGSQHADGRSTYEEPEVRSSLASDIGPGH